jgi:hypothetical protein
MPRPLPAIMCERHFSAEQLGQEIDLFLSSGETPDIKREAIFKLLLARDHHIAARAAADAIVALDARQSRDPHPDIRGGNVIASGQSVIR